MFVKANAGAEDKYYIAGHVFRIISCLNQVLFACNNAYCINEKKAIKLLETFEYKPKKYYCCPLNMKSQFEAIVVQ